MLLHDLYFHKVFLHKEESVDTYNNILFIASVSLLLLKQHVYIES